MSPRSLLREGHSLPWASRISALPLWGVLSSPCSSLQPLNPPGNAQGGRKAEGRGGLPVPVAGASGGGVTEPGQARLLSHECVKAVYQPKWTAAYLGAARRRLFPEPLFPSPNRKCLLCLCAFQGPHLSPYNCASLQSCTLSGSEGSFCNHHQNRAHCHFQRTKK